MGERMDCAFALDTPDDMGRKILDMASKGWKVAELVVRGDAWSCTFVPDEGSGVPLTDFFDVVKSNLDPAAGRTRPVPMKPLGLVCDRMGSSASYLPIPPASQTGDLA